MTMSGTATAKCGVWTVITNLSQKNSKRKPKPRKLKPLPFDPLAAVLPGKKFRKSPRRFGGDGKWH